MDDLIYGYGPINAQRSSTQISRLSEVQSKSRENEKRDSALHRISLFTRSETRGCIEILSDGTVRRAKKDNAEAQRARRHAEETREPMQR
jgi:hypothetical protein